MTPYRRRVEYDMVDDPRHIPSDQELLQLVEDINQQLPYLGEVMVMGRLRSMGYYVTRSRLRLAIRTYKSSAALGRKCQSPSSIFCTRTKLTVAYR